MDYNRKLLTELEQLLKKDARMVSGDDLLKNKIMELALKLDKELIKLLMSNERFKEHFFVEIAGATVFDKDKFIRFVNNKEFLPDSYTSFKNKIGLTANGDYLIEKNDVSLAWAFKDCVLEGGQEREDEKRDEIFYNEILAPDEIDRLLETKVFTNFKRIDKNGEHKITEIKNTDNLIIRGNNLLALHSLKKRFAERVKMIYIDPPYNTGNDDFNYNDSFNHSSWLTFMKNRLEVAREFLREDGAIFIQIDDNEEAYLKVLCDEIFGRDNFVICIVLNRSAPTGHKVINPSPVNVTDFILVYAKKRSFWKYKPQYVERDYDEAYDKVIINLGEGYKKWKWKSIKEVVAKELGFNDAKEAKKKLGAEFQVKIEEYAVKNPQIVFRFSAVNIEAVSKELQEVIKDSKHNPEKIYFLPRKEHSDFYIKDGERLTFYTTKIKEIDGNSVTAEALSNIWYDITWQGIAKEGDVTLRGGKKPERLIQRIIEMGTENGEIVMDFFLGSGTTTAVAHKMGRQYIGIEQLGYEKNDVVARLKNVINGDTTGISKAVNWNGGGNFVYCELMKWNEKYVDEIRKAKTTKELLKIWNIMKEKAFLSYNVDIKQFDENAEDFGKLSLENQKKFLMEVLDKNQLYVNLSEIEDSDYEVSKEDKNLNKRFYEGL